MDNNANVNNGMGGMNLPTVNYFAYPSEVCSECGSEVFLPGVIFKRVPGVLLGAGSETVSVPIKVAACAKCGALSPSDRARLDEETEKAKQTAKTMNNNSGLII